MNAEVAGTCVRSVTRPQRSVRSRSVKLDGSFIEGDNKQSAIQTECTLGGNTAMLYHFKLLF